METSTRIPSRPRPLVQWIITIVLLAVGLAIVAVTSPWWLPPASAHFSRLMAGDPPEGAAEHEGHEHEHEHAHIDSLELTPEATKTLGVKPLTLEYSSYQRVIRIPGRTVVVPGIGIHEVTAGASGEIAKIFIQQGQSIAPSQPLFEVKLVHDDSIKLQGELVDALAEKEVVNAEITRLEELEKRAPARWWARK